MMCLMIESYLPLDFFVEMHGATAHAKILLKILAHFKIQSQLLAKFEELCYPIVNLTARTYLSLFAHTLPEPASLRVFDYFFLEGLGSNKVIFDITLGYLRLIE